MSGYRIHNEINELMSSHRLFERSVVSQSVHCPTNLPLDSKLEPLGQFTISATSNLKS